MQRARGLVGPLRRPAALHDDALQAGVSGSECSGAGPARPVWPSWPRPAAALCAGAVQSGTLPRAPGAPEPSLPVKSGPPGYASPHSATLSTCVRPCGLAATSRHSPSWRSPSWRSPSGRLGLRVPRSRSCSSSLARRATPRRVLRPPRHATCAWPRGPAATSRRPPSWSSSIWRLGFRVPRSPPCSSSLALRASPHRALRLSRLQRARGHVGSLRRHAASQAGALLVVVSGPGCPGACPARQVWIAGPMVPDALSCGRSLLWAPASLLWSWMLAPTDARPSRVSRHSPRLPSVNWLGSLPVRLATSFLAAISLSQGLTRPVQVGARRNGPGGRS
jgi:hypothetical protein